ncbi:alanine aminotransferase 1-like [Watersipora subatra]|uniref:alanine aminotransferase 1-like n=1 Tax=Watersipora subatra TaxID=2589382 RepID=UPI00355C152F
MLALRAQAATRFKAISSCLTYLRAATHRNVSSKVLTVANMNPNVKRMEYAVRGPIVQKAVKIQDDLNSGKEMPFTEVVRANIGDCHATGQQPLTFIRQVLALCTYPELLDDPRFPEDTKAKAKRILSGCGGNSMGAYTESGGIRVIRQDIAEYISERDGYNSNWENVSLSTGASEAIKSILQILNSPGPNGESTGVMVPIPQYPLYSATMAEYNIQQIDYFLDEANQWSLSTEELQRSYDSAKDKCVPRAIVIINPGNPTGQVLSKQNIADIIKFAHKEKLFILADEVYQHNIWAEDREFHSFKKVLCELGSEYSDVQLASFMTVSKGYMGECGLRGGYVEVVNLDDDVMAMLNKLNSAKLCSNTHGQATMDCVVKPPQPGDPSYELFTKEKDAVLASLRSKAKLVTKTFNSIEGVRCNEVQGAMYCFPNIDIPQRAAEHAKSKGMAPDAFYCFELLEKTGLCVVPGSGFGQREGTHHFRCTLLPPEEQFRAVMKRFEVFHKNFLAEWS